MKTVKSQLEMLVNPTHAGMKEFAALSWVSEDAFALQTSLVTSVKTKGIQALMHAGLIHVLMVVGVFHVARMASHVDVPQGSVVPFVKLVTSS